MKRFLSTVVFCCLTGMVYGQLNVSVEASRNKYITYEPVTLTISIRNQSGTTLDFGASKFKGGKLFFLVTDQRGQPVKERFANLNPAKGLVIPRGSTKQLKVVLNNFYDITGSGQYQVKAQVEHPQLKMGFRSKQVLFEIKPGVAIHKERFGVVNKKGMSETRTISFLTIKDKGDQTLCMKIEDENIIYRFIRLAPMATGFKPRVEVDARNEIHILMQTESRKYTYWRFDQNGQVKERSMYPVLGKAAPLLHRDPDIGRVMVIGHKEGGQDIKPGDIPIYTRD